MALGLICIISWLLHEVHQAAVCQDLTLISGEILEEEVKRMNAVLSDYLCVNLLLTREDSLTDAGNEDLIALLELELYVLSDGERNDTPVDTVRAITLCSVLVANISVATKHLLARSSLLTSRTVTRTISEYARTE